MATSSLAPTTQEEPIGAPVEGYVRVAVKSIGLNLADVFAIIGLYSATPKGAFKLDNDDDRQGKEND